MIKREMQDFLLELAKQYPVVTITGPRQSGKTTLCGATFPNKNYVNLERPDQREFAQDDPIGFLNRFPDGAVIDEIQKSPSLLSYIQDDVDKHRQNGRYILTGSHNFLLMEKVSQSLAGRTAILELLPFSLKEAYSQNVPSIDEVIYKGFYPRIFDQNQIPDQAYAFYVNSYAERDLRSLINIKDLSNFDRFLKILAAHTGQLLNFNAISNSLGISHNTARQWTSILEASYIIKLVRPYHTNLSKRIIKSPKLYFIDTGIACNLLGIKEPSHVASHPLRGALFENMIIMEAWKHLLNKADNTGLYFIRDSKQHEIDLMFEKGSEALFIEIKSSQTVNKDFFKNLKYFKKLFPSSKTMLIYGGNENFTRDNLIIKGWKNINWE